MKTSERPSFVTRNCVFCDTRLESLTQDGSEKEKEEKKSGLLLVLFKTKSLKVHKKMNEIKSLLSFNVKFWRVLEGYPQIDHQCIYRIYSIKRRPRINAAVQSRNINKRRPRKNAAVKNCEIDNDEENDFSDKH